MKSVFSRLFQPASKQSAPIAQMAPEDRAVIVAYAEGDKTKKADAIAIHRKWIDVIGVRGTPEQDFMAEVDHPCPDLALRSHYRAVLLASAGTAATR